MTSVTPLRLSWTAKLGLALEIALSSVRVRWLLRRTDLPTTLARLRAPVRATAGGPRLSAGDAARLARAVRRTLGALPGKARCLVTSLVLVALLARRGVAGMLVIGVRPGSEFGAHAWVELDGAALLPSEPGEFGRLVEL